MGALSYLFLTKLKNRLLSLLKSPGKLIYILFLAAIIIFTVWGGNQGDKSGQTKFRDIHELIAGTIVVFSMIFIFTVKSGFGIGASLFSMADVNFLFPSPISPRKILVFGLIQQMGTSMLIGFFVLFQYSWLHNTFGIGFDSLLLIFLGCVISAFLGQITAMVIYTSTSASEQKRRAVKYALAAVVCAFLLYAFVFVMGSGANISALIEAVNTPVFRLLPVSGWLGSMLTGVFLTGFTDAALGIGLCILLLIVDIFLILFLKLDYYEDVLKSTEITHSAITAKKEGNIKEAVPQNVKIGKTGFSKGWGADAFYYKHLIENRRSRVFIIDMPSLIFAACIIIFTFFVRSIGIGAIFSFATYMQIFSIALGRINKELIRPFIYLVPEPPLKKLLWCIRESLMKYVLEALIIFIPVAFIIGLTPVEAFLCIIARLSFSFLFTAGNMLVERIWGGGSSKALVFVLYFTILILLSLPGILLAVLLSVVFSVAIISPNAVIFLSLIICNIPASLLAFYLARNMLQYAELNNK